MSPLPSRFGRLEIAVLVFNLGYLAIAAPVALGRANHEFVMYLAVVLLAIGGLLALHRRVALHPATLWLLSCWGLAHMAGGLAPAPAGAGVLYNWWLIPERLKFDQVVHAFGFGVTTWVCWQALRRKLNDPTPRLGVLVLCVAAGVGFGALNEVVEFVATLVVPETNVGGYANTAWDLVANLVGALSAAVLIRLRSGRPAPPAATGG